MLRRGSLVAMVIVLLVQHQSLSFKTLPELKKQYKTIENKEFSASDHLVGKAMDFIYSNRTVMSLIARELWNVGSRAIDKIVDLKGNVPANKGR